MLYARKKLDFNNDYEFQTLDEHLSKVSSFARDFANNIGLGNVSALAGLLHDIGKASQAFQNYLIKGGRKGEEIHSTQGAIFSFLKDSNQQTQVLREILSMIISAHHNHLKDGCSIDGTDIFLDKLNDKENPDLHYDEIIKNLDKFFKDKIETENLLEKANEEIISVTKKIGQTYMQNCESAHFAVGLLVKYIYSCLIDADRLDAYLYDIKEKYNNSEQNWQNLINTFETNISQFPNDNIISKIRSSISDKCKAAADIKETGIYQLSVPTGGGKTLSSLRFALHHCKKLNKKRIIYVIPYLSIIEQTAKNIRDILNLSSNSDILLEDHSGIVMSDDEKENELQKFAASRWDSPIVITTMVQFLETAMSSRGSKLRKFHNMSDSVIIFDEIQSIPVKSINLFNEVVSFLSKFCNSTILLCTATQPLLSQTDRKNLLLHENPDLNENMDEAFKNLKRTNIIPQQEMDYDSFANFVFEKAKQNDNCLAILNTKKSAKAIYDKIKNLNLNKEFKIYHLSTSMCSVHRIDIFKIIRESLEKKEKIICITTQLIEAGVDISFACVIRSMAGLDSISQAAGRCNRNGESNISKSVYAIPLIDENLDKLYDIKIGKMNTERIIHENKESDLLDSSIMKKYYKYYFSDKKNEMDYITKEGKSVYAMLSLNGAGSGNYKNKYGRICPCFIKQAFHTANENFSVIDKNTESVVVRYKDAENLIEELKKLPKDKITKKWIEIIRKLEKYSVSLFEWEMQKLNKQNAISSFDEESGIKFLDKNFYSDETGVLLDTSASFLSDS